MKLEGIGVCTCLLKIGVVLTPLGGALARLHGMFKVGLGAIASTHRPSGGEMIANLKFIFQSVSAFFSHFLFE